MIDFLSMLDIEYADDKKLIDDFITGLIAEREVLKEWSNYKFNDIVDIKRRYTEDVSILVRSTLNEENALDVRLFIVTAESGQFNRSEEVRVSYNPDNIVAVAYTESEKEGTPINFVVSNVEDYEEAIKSSSKVSGVYLSGFAGDGMIVLPIDEEESEVGIGSGEDMINKVLGGDMTDEDFLNDMTMIKELLKTEDVLSVLEVYFFPIQDFDTMYSTLGIILEVDKARIRDSEGFLYKLKIKTMGLLIDVFINEKVLLGEPSVGMRFKGNIWLQGKIAFV